MGAFGSYAAYSLGCGQPQPPAAGFSGQSFADFQFAQPLVRFFTTGSGSRAQGLGTLNRPSTICGVRPRGESSGPKALTHSLGQ